MTEQELTYRSKGKRKNVRYATKARMEKVNPKNIRAYEAYLRSRTIGNKDVVDTTYKVYRSYFNIFMCFILEHYDNSYLYDEDFLDEMVEVMEDYIGFLQDELGNGKKAINTKISAVSSFYFWSAKRGKISSHPFDGKLDRIKNANEEKIIAEYFLNKEEVDKIDKALETAGQEGSKYDMIDKLLWHISYDSACRIGALRRLTVSSLDLERNSFIGIREKRGKIVNIPFYPKTAEMIKEFLELREELGVDCDELFYVKHDGEWRGMSKQSIYNRIVRFGHIIGIGDFRPHCIRKTRLNMVAKLDINKAKVLANHDSLDTTSKFYTEKEDQADTLASIMALEQQEQQG